MIPRARRQPLGTEAAVPEPADQMRADQTPVESTSSGATEAGSTPVESTAVGSKASGSATVTSMPVDSTLPGSRLAGSALIGSALAAVSSALIAAGLTGALKPSVLVDTGVLVRWGLPLVSALTHLAAALTVGSLVLACLAFPAASGRGRAYQPALRLASASAGMWALGTVVSAVLQYADVSGLRMDDPAFGAGLAEFLRDVQFGRYFAFTAVIAAVLALVAAGATTMTSTGLLCLLSLWGLVPPALAGHSAALTSHETAVTSLGLHLLGVSVWVGGLLTLILVFPDLSTLPTDGRHDDRHGDRRDQGNGRDQGSARDQGPSPLGTAVSRFSGLAGWSLALVATSGLVNASLRLDHVAAWFSAYGVLVLLKAFALVVLGLAGWWHRRRLLPGLTPDGSRTHSSPAAASTTHCSPTHSSPTAASPTKLPVADATTAPARRASLRRAFLRLAVGEALVMGVAIGLAAALSRTAPPPRTGQVLDTSAAEAITGYPMPAAPTLVHWLTQWQPDLLWLVVAALMAVLYLNGVRRLRARGDRWPVSRTLNWLIGIALLVWLTSGGPMAYGRVAFSAHMIGHMALSMVVPLFLVFGAPVTLALRSVHPRRDGTRGPREWLLGALETRFLRVVSHPVTAAILFAFSLVIFYYSGLFRLALTTHLGHELMHAHFLVAGYLFVNALVGIDPGPSRPPYPMRLLLLFATMGFHAFFGVALTQGSGVLQEAFFASLHRPWHPDLLADQRLGGGIAWGLGEIPTLMLALVLAVQWSRSDDREARRRDRAADRDGDAELAEYNAMLARLAGRVSPPRDSQ